MIFRSSASLIALAVTSLLGACAAATANAITPPDAIPFIHARLVPAHTAAPAYPSTLRRFMVAGQVIADITVNAAGAVDTAATQIYSSSNKAFERTLRQAMASWRMLPARRNGMRVADTVRVEFIFATAECNAAGRRPPPRIDANANTAVIETTECSLPDVSTDPKNQVSRRATMSGVWSLGFEDGFYTPCRDVILPIKVPPGTSRTVWIDLTQHDSATAKVQRQVRALTDSNLEHRFFVRWEGMLTGGSAGHMGIARYSFRPDRLISIEPWSTRSCPI